MAVRKKVRFEVFRRDGFTCQYCGRKPPDAILQVDHIVPRADHGTDEIDNLITSCRACNLGKGARPLGAKAVPKRIAKQRKRQVERAEQLAEYNNFLLERRQELEANTERVVRLWENLTDGCHEKKGYVDRVEPEHRHSIMQFLRQLPYAEVYDAMELGCMRLRESYQRDRRFRYFCGVCWKKIRGE